MWDCPVCGTINIINPDICPGCFTPRPPAAETPVTEDTGHENATEEAAMEPSAQGAEPDVAASDAADPTPVPPDAGAAGSGAPTGPEPADTGRSGTSEAEPSAGGFLTSEWGR